MAAARRRDDVYVHPRALCESRDIGSGTRIWAFAHVMRGAHVGGACNIGDHAFLESGAWIGDRVTVKNGVLIWRGVRIADDAFIGPGVVFANDRNPRSPRMAGAEPVLRRYEGDSWLATTGVGRGASLGAGAVILPGLEIGAFAVVGAGAVVTRNVAPHAIVRGNPARRAGYACVCGMSLPAARGGRARCRSCGSAYRVSRAGLTAATP